MKFNYYELGQLLQYDHHNMNSASIESEFHAAAATCCVNMHESVNNNSSVITWLVHISMGIYGRCDYVSTSRSRPRIMLARFHQHICGSLDSTKLKM